MAKGSFLSPLLRQREAAHRLYNQTSGRVLAEHVEVAGDSASRRRGLLGRDDWPAGNALVIAPCSSIHTFFMRFPIDVVFVRRSGEVVRWSAHVPAWRIRLALSAFAVIELPAGTLASAPVAVGDLVGLAPR